MDRYVIVTEEAVDLDSFSMKRFQRKVNEKIEQGYAPAGGVCFYRRDYLRKQCVSQAMVLERGLPED